ncbi:hypothetical protein ACFOD7_15555, partial [Paracoccus fontiphilus]
FVADATGLGTIREFHSGAFERSNVSSDIRLNGILSIDLINYKGTKATTWTLMNADRITGNLDDIKINGLEENRDAKVYLDSLSGKLMLSISESGRGSGSLVSTGIGENIIQGTVGRDILTGTNGRDLLIGGGGNFDQLTGGDGADVFYFGQEALDGVRARTSIMDYEVGVDSLALAKGVAVASIQQAGSTVVLYLDDPAGYDDAIYVRGDGVSIDNLSILNDYYF